MLERLTIDLWASPTERIEIMSENNSDARDILIKLYKSDPSKGYSRLLIIDDMNIRGEQIKYGFNNICEQNLDYFITKSESRDSLLIEELNKSARSGKFGDIAPIAGKGHFYSGNRQYEIL